MEEQNRANNLPLFYHKENSPVNALFDGNLVNKLPAPLPPRKLGIWLLANEISRKMVTKYQ